MFLSRFDNSCPQFAERTTSPKCRKAWCLHQSLTTYGRSLLKEQQALNVRQWNACIPIGWLTGEVCRRSEARCKDNTPYAKEIANCFSKNSPIREIAIIKGVQLGFTTAIFENKGWMLEKSKLAWDFDNSCPKFAQAKRSVKQGWMLDFWLKGRKNKSPSLLEALTTHARSLHKRSGGECNRL